MTSTQKNRKYFIHIYYSIFSIFCQQEIIKQYLFLGIVFQFWALILNLNFNMQIF